jgi:hypothetical protein
MTSGELIANVTREIKGLSVQFTSDNMTDAVAEAQRETGFTLPNSVDEQTRWLKQRTTRHLIYMIWLENSVKFKVKTIALDQKFDHLNKVLAKMDKDWEKAKDDPLMGVIVEAHEQFGHRIGAGFSYDDVGNDTTYESENYVPISPNESD